MVNGESNFRVIMKLGVNSLIKNQVMDVNKQSFKGRSLAWGLWI
jgi:hypothetical protein